MPKCHCGHCLYATKGSFASIARFGVEFTCVKKLTCNASVIRLGQMEGGQH